MRPLQNTVITQIKKLRTSGLSFDNIAQKLDISRESATKYSSEIALSDDDRYQMLAKSLRKYTYNTSVFTREDAVSYYLLGAFMTDGHVDDRLNMVRLTSKDRDWLEAIRDITCPNRPLFKVKISNAYILSISGRDVVRWLMSKGCTPKKSLTIKFPTVPKRYMADFIRGCFDGDGCLCIFKSKAEKNPSAYSYISSASKPFVRDMGKVLEGFGIKTTLSKMGLCNSVIRGRKVIARNHLYRLHLSKVSTYKLCRWMYYPGCLCLARKSKKANDIADLCERTCTPKFIEVFNEAA